MCLPSYGQVDTTIYGIARNTLPGEIYFSKLNASTGEVTNISSSSLASQYTLAGTAVDPYSKTYYFITDGKFVGVDMVTGNIVSSPTITNSNGTYFDGFLFNRADSTIYGLARKPLPGAIYLAKINPTTGVVTNISLNSLATQFTVTSTTIDPTNNIFYFISEEKFVGIDMDTGDIVSNPMITNTNGTYFDGFIFNCSDSTIYGLARKPLPGAIYLSKINPSTGVVTNISSNSLATQYTLLSTTIGPDNNTFYFITDEKFVGVDMTTGNTVSNPIITNTNGTYFDGFRSVGTCNDKSLKINETKGSNKISIYPNPAINEINVDISETGNYRAELVNSLGEIVYSKYFTQTDSIKIELTKFQKGIYFILLKSKNTIVSEKVMLTK